MNNNTFERNSITTEYGIFHYEVLSKNDSLVISILGYEGNHGLVLVPEKIEATNSTTNESLLLPVTTISDKAFFNNGIIEKMILPDSICEIGDWAFSHMSKLTTLTIPANNITLGKQIFLDSPKLVSIQIKDQKDSSIDFYMMASMIILKNPLLFSPKEAGCESWYQNFDSAVETFLLRPEGADFEPVFLGWFNDEDEMDTQYPRYLKKLRSNKAALSLNRIHHPIYLSEEKRNIYIQYIKDNLEKGVWEWICSDQNINDTFYVQFLLDEGLICEENIDSYISDLASLNASEATVLLLNYKNRLQKKDFFAALDTL